MLRRAHRRAQEVRPQIELRPAAAEALPFDDRAFDHVVVTLVLCTVDQPDRALSEMQRVLRPDGTLRLIEHVRGDGGLGRAQDALVPVWSWVGAGCHPNRRTAESLRASGFDIVEPYERQLCPAPLIAGTARIACS